MRRKRRRMRRRRRRRRRIRRMRRRRRRRRRMRRRRKRRRRRRMKRRIRKRRIRRMRRRKRRRRRMKRRKRRRRRRMRRRRRRRRIGRRRMRRRRRRRRRCQTAAGKEHCTKTQPLIIPIRRLSRSPSMKALQEHSPVSHSLSQQFEHLQGQATLPRGTISILFLPVRYLVLPFPECQEITCSSDCFNTQSALSCTLRYRPVET